MDKAQVERRAYELFQGGLICSEAIYAAVLEGSGKAPAEIATGVATPFGGGVGRSREEMCGALAGGLVALGALRGRAGAGCDWDDVADKAADFRERVLALTGRTSCKEVLAALGPQENMEKCKRYTASAAGILYELLEDARPAGAPRTCGCCAAGN
ncbi:hypothetical protein NNJEOMEG_03181 [Fundidesulfovibrio magnetotacticus]|uniref:C_GCAxxG_C_C family redox protein n=1 Tax=Fundidesulfovibrio magnetotacticus TaxID=2730080 RepID=A0A6V8LS73_9BACT|nr:C-GCAxxG-C-C family protein [Fundidesulfovibrio magnetotacticus]GFK95322.1 hypothetical protein NNJEOMEG_03181 [Fundidesulfovibrio magnetotacticus]